MSRTETLRAMREALRYLQTHLDAEVSAQRILTLIGVAENPASPQFELGKVIGSGNASTISRNLNDLSHLTSRRQPGPGYIRQDPDPNSRRRNLVNLTPRGEVLVNGMVDAFNKALERK